MQITLIANRGCDVVKQMLKAAPQIKFTKPNSNTFSDFDLYLITPTDIQGNKIPAGLIELIENSNKNPKRTFFAFIVQNQHGQLSSHQQNALTAIGNMIKNNGATFLKTLPSNAQQWQNLIESTQ